VACPDIQNQFFELTADGLVRNLQSAAPSKFDLLQPFAVACVLSLPFACPVQELSMPLFQASVPWIDFL
jgi:hypothetical protein